MSFHPIALIRNFYRKNLFERLIVYLLLSALICKFVFELILGQSSFLQSQNRQWLFYGFLALDYLVSYKKVVGLRIGLNANSAYGVVLFIMMAHGLFVGLVLGNQPFIIFNDLVPVLMIALNIWRMQSASENATPVDFNFLIHACIYMAFGVTICGFVAVALGRPSEMAFPAAQLFLPLVMAMLFMTRPIPRHLLVLIAISAFLALPELNRSNMIFAFVAVGGYTFIKFIKNPVIGVVIGMIGIIVLSSAVLMLPEDSKTYRRIISLTQLDLSKRTGSVGERQAENDAIDIQLASGGETIQWLGLGFGGQYEVQFSHEYIKNYGHAHYSWAWFKLRYGQTGYFYLMILVSLLLYNMVSGLKTRTELGVFTGLICLCALIYCVTYVNAVFLLSGLQFFNVKQELAQRKPVDVRGTA